MAGTPTKRLQADRLQAEEFLQAGFKLLKNERFHDLSLICGDGRVVRANRSFIAGDTVVLQNQVDHHNHPASVCTCSSPVPAQRLQSNADIVQEGHLISAQTGCAARFTATHKTSPLCSTL